MADGYALEIQGLVTGYGKSQVLNGLDLTLGWGEIVSIIGPNGAGKSTLLKALLGILPFRQGTLKVGGKDVTAQNTPARLAAGIALVPEGGRVFGPLTVQENLELGGLLLENSNLVRERTIEMYALFPRLAERKRQLAGTLSGGERQMLAVARGLMMKPRILLLDEPSLGLAPMFVDLVMRTLRQLVDSQGISVFLVEQNARAALTVSNRVYVMNVGQIIHKSDDPASLLDGAELLRFLDIHSQQGSNTHVPI